MRYAILLVMLLGTIFSCCNSQEMSPPFGFTLRSSSNKNPILFRKEDIDINLISNSNQKQEFNFYLYPEDNDTIRVISVSLPSTKDQTSVKYLIANKQSRRVDTLYIEYSHNKCSGVDISQSLLNSKNGTFSKSSITVFSVD